jgi:hypothetical protein
LKPFSGVSQCPDWFGGALHSRSDAASPSAPSGKGTLPCSSAPNGGDNGIQLPGKKEHFVSSLRSGAQSSCKREDVERLIQFRSYTPGEVDRLAPRHQGTFPLRNCLLLLIGYKGGKHLAAAEEHQSEETRFSVLPDAFMHQL